MTERHLSPQEIADRLVGDSGFYLHRALLSEAETDSYRLECEAFFESGPRVAKWPGYGRNRLDRDHVADYVFSRPNAHSSKIYQFPANPHSPATEAIFHRALSMRDAIEARWLDDPKYCRVTAAQRDYVQASFDDRRAPPARSLRRSHVTTGSRFIGWRTGLVYRAGRANPRACGSRHGKGDALFSISHSSTRSTRPSGWEALASDVGVPSSAPASAGHTAFAA